MVNFAIVGCGHIAKKHAEAIEKAPGAKLIAVCDTDSTKMSYFEEQYHVQTFTNLDDLLELNNLDVINICTPSGYHANIAVKSARKGKHVIVEKPIALTLEDTNQIINACNENQVKLAVVHPNRFRPVMMELKKIMDQNLLGKLSHVNCTVRWNRNQEYYEQAPWRGTKSLDGGVLMNQAIHNIDLMLWLVGDVEEIMSMDATRLRKIEAEDVSVSLVRFTNGALGVVEAATTIYPKNLEESLSIFGEKGSIIVGGANALYFKHLDIEGITEKEKQELINKIEKDPFGKPGHQWIIEDMVNSIQEDREPAVTGEDGKKALQFVVSAYKAAEDKQIVNLTKKEV